VTSSRPDRAARQNERPAEILRAAERLFAQKGYHATTMREVATAAGVGLSLVVYHFKSKDALYYAIFERRQYVNEERLKRLESVDLVGPAALEAIIDAFIEPVLALHESPDDIWYARLVFREAADPSSQERSVISVLFDPMARAFIAALEQALPGKRPGFYPWAYLFSVGALTQSSFDDRIGNLVTAPAFDQKNEVLRSYIRAALAYG